MTTVLRVEHPSGPGPYINTCDLPDDLRDLLDEELSPYASERHPSLYDDLYDLQDDPEADIPGDYMCGFTGPAQLLDWFDADERAALQLAGYHVAEYAIDHPDDVMLGDRQLMFPEWARVVRTFPVPS
jgi:hypothetical protein